MLPPMRLLHLSGSLQNSIGGPPQALLGILTGLASNNVNIEIIKIEPRNFEASEVDESIEMVIKRLTSLTTSPALARYQFSLKFPILFLRRVRHSDVVVSHGFYSFSLLFALVTKKLHKKPIFVMPHGSVEPYQERVHRIRKSVFRKIMRNGIGINAFFVATSMEKSMAESNEWIKSPVREVGIGIHSQVQNGNSISIDNSKKYLLFIGRIACKKRIDLSIEALNILRKSGFDVCLKIAGNGDEAILLDLVNRANRLGIGSHVSFMGEITGERKWELIRKAEATLLPSENENFAVSVAESILLGTPAVVSFNVALSNVVLNYQAGEVIGELDPIELSGKIQKVMENRDFYSKNCTVASAEFDPEVIGRRWLDAIYYYLESEEGNKSNG